MVGKVPAKVHWSEVTTDQCTLCAQYGNYDYWINVCDRSVLCYRINVQYSYVYQGILYYDAANRDYYTNKDGAQRDQRTKYAANSMTDVFIDSRVPNTSSLMRGRLPFRVTSLDVFCILASLLLLPNCMGERLRKRSNLLVPSLPTIAEENADTQNSRSDVACKV